jgi:hypothetical protein
MWQLILHILLVIPPYSVRQPYCGIERADVKCLADPGASLIDYTPIETTVSDQLDCIRDSNWAKLGPRLPSEMNVYRIKGYILGVKWETGKKKDGDYHIIIGDKLDSKETMVVEVPDPQCDYALNSGRSPDYAAVRQWIDRAVRKVMNKKVGHYLVIDKPIPIVVEGVGFWDKDHGARGAAHNNRELHPGLLIN